MRSRIVQWQPQLRMIYVTRITLLKYRLGLPGFELPEKTHAAQLAFDEWLAQKLDDMADRLEGKAPRTTASDESSIDLLQKAAQIPSGQSEATFAAHMQTFLSLSRSIVTSATSLDKEI
jgi:multidrug resistance protein MdtO